jgi:protein tyrosine phosphatase
LYLNLCTKGYLHPNEYIATQGPKYESTFDFWRMVLQCHVEVVVMLTQLMENEREKCYQYYPKFNEEAIYNNIHVKCTQEINLHVYVRRLFQISRVRYEIIAKKKYQNTVFSKFYTIVCQRITNNGVVHIIVLVNGPIMVYHSRREI